MTRTMMMRIWLAVLFLTSLAGGLRAQAPAAPAPAAGLPMGSVVEDENGFKMLTPYIDPKLKPQEAGELRRRESQARTMVQQVLGGAPLSESKRQFDYYYQNMLFPRLTQTDAASLTELPEERQKLFRDHLERCSDPAIHQYLAEMILAQMQAVVNDNFHPVVRYNAMLAISSLNDVDASRVGANKTTPEPMERALPIIIEQFKKADNSDAIRVAALLGLLRHLEWDNFRGPVGAPAPSITPPQRKAIVDSLLALALQKDPPPGRNAEGHQWFRRRAIEGLTYAGYYKVDAEVAAAMDTLLKDETESLAMRCAAAAAVGQMTYQAPVKLETTPTAKELGFLALLACHKELTRVAEMNKQEIERLTRLQGATGGGYGGGYGAESGMPGGSMTGRMGPGMPGGSGADGEVYQGPRPGGTVRPRAPGVAGGADMMSGEMSGMPGGPGGYGSGGAVQTPQDPKQYRFDYIRRRIRSQLYAVETGLVGPDGFQKYLAKAKQEAAAAPKDAAAPAGPAPDPNDPPRGVAVLAKDKAEKDYVKKVIDAVVNVARAVEETDTDLADLDKELRKQMKPLETLTRKIAVAAPIAAPSDLPEVPDLPGARVAPPVPEGPAAAEAAPAAPAPAAPAPVPPAAPAPVAPAPMPAAAAAAVPG